MTTDPSSSEPNVPRHQFHPLRVSRVIDETHDARSLVFAIPDALRNLFQYRAGQFLTLEVAPGGGPAVRRCYSLASSPQCDAEHKVTVKRVAGGKVSNWINDHVRAGDVLSVLPPDGRFVLPSGGAGPLFFFAGGSGITPIIALIKTALIAGARPLHLVYANRDERSIIFRAELADLAAKNPGRLRATLRLDAVHGFLAAADVAAHVTSQSAGTAATAEAFLCGPRAFMDVVENQLLASGLDPARIHIEHFFSLTDAAPAPVTTAPAPTPPATTTAAPQLDIILDGKTRTIPSKPGKTILESAFAAGLDPPHSCQEGVCGSCIAKLCDGEVDMVDTGVLSKSDRQRHLIVTCQSKPKTPRCKIDYSAV